ncbi:MAG: sigma-54-dependent Fis family transcriptional regulator, partial [Leptospiraceae bacterium]|nr:sigma-54-dependent Fis family transcriptional regulator [Leptospiraceae bacterium]
FLIPLRLRQSSRYSDVPMTETMILEIGLPTSLGPGSSFYRKYQRIALRIENVMRSLQEEGFRVVVPLIYESRLIGFIGLGDKADHSPYYNEDVQLLDAIRLSVSIYLHNHIYFESLESSRNQARSEAQRLSQFLADRRVVRRDLDEHTLIYKSEIMHQSVEQVHRASGSNRPVLITGETGTGKELIARLIHHSDREGKPFVVVNCAAIPASLLEDEIFGHIKGAFTDARSDRLGKAAEAGEGTLFFDEVGEMPLELQAKLLRLLQDGQFSPVGDNRTIRAQCRFIFATNRNLKASIAEGLFREDLYYRINAFAVELPPLRERKEDIGALAEHFCRDMARELGRSDVRIESDALSALESYSWPGNIRELQNVLLRALAGSDARVMVRADLPQELQAEKQRVIPTRKSVAIHATEEIVLEEPLNDLVENYTRRVIEAALEKTGGNRTHAAGLLGLGRTALLYRMKQLGL